MDIIQLGLVFPENQDANGGGDSEFFCFQFITVTFVLFLSYCPAYMAVFSCVSALIPLKGLLLCFCFHLQNVHHELTF